MSASRTSCRVGSSVRSRSGTMRVTPTRPSSAGPMPPPPRKPNSGTSSISTSAMIQRVVGSQPAKSIPAALRTALQQRHPIVVAGGEVADVHRDPSERLHLHRLPLGEEAIDDTALVQHLDGAGVQTSGARALELEAGASLDDEDVGPRQRQLRRQHHPRRTTAGDHNCMLGHTPLLISQRLSGNSAPYPGACGKPREPYYIEVEGVGPFYGAVRSCRQ